MSSEFDYKASKVKVSGQSPAPPNRQEMEHGEEVYFLARGAIKEVAFVEEKDGSISRVATIKLEKGFVVEPQGAEELIAEDREHRTGQGNLDAEVKRAAKEALDSKVTDIKDAKTDKPKKERKPRTKKGEPVDEATGEIAPKEDAGGEDWRDKRKGADEAPTPEQTSAQDVDDEFDEDANEDVEDDDNDLF